MSSVRPGSCKSSLHELSTVPGMCPAAPQLPAPCLPQQTCERWWTIIVLKTNTILGEGGYWPAPSPYRKHLVMLSLHKPVKFEVKNKFLSCLLMKLRHLLIKKFLIDSFQCLFFAQTNRLIKVKDLCGQTSGIKTNCLNALF